LNLAFHLRCTQAKLSQWLTPTITVDGIRFYCPTPVTVWRGYTLLTKEPETIEWIDTFEPKSIFWDIGANVGCYSLYAAKRGHSVVAFEPAASNYAVLNRNIELNDVHVDAFNVALSDWNGPALLGMNQTDPGHAFHRLHGDGKYHQAIMSFTGDVFAPYPHHVKIDVDGTELEILKGMPLVLKQAKSVLVECDGTARDDAIMVLLDSYGLKEKWRKYNALFVR
jgi:FkbM family methyltransferase